MHRIALSLITRVGDQNGKPDSVDLSPEACRIKAHSGFGKVRPFVAQSGGSASDPAQIGNSIDFRESLKILRAPPPIHDESIWGLATTDDIRGLIEGGNSIKGMIRG